MYSIDEYFEYKNVNIENLADKIVNLMALNPDLFIDKDVTITVNDIVDTEEELNLLTEAIRIRRPDVEFILKK